MSLHKEISFGSEIFIALPYGEVQEQVIRSI